MTLFKLRGILSARMSFILAILGISFVLIIWFILTSGANPIVTSAILPKPSRVLSAYADLYRDNEIFRNTFLSVGLNLAGYLEAIAISFPLGFIIGLYPVFRGSFQRQVDAVRYIPLTALTGLFIVWFGIGTSMKVHFLAFGILIYLLPVIVQRIDEVNDVYLKTVYTLGASDWQTIRTVYIPSVISRLSDDIRVLTAISWTYIIVAEGIGSTGGIGALIWRAGLRQGRIDKVFAILLIIMLIGVLQDKLFIYLDRLFFPHKYQIKESTQYKKSRENAPLHLVWNYLRSMSVWLFIGLYALLVWDIFFKIFGDVAILQYLFSDTILAVHLIMWLIIGYQVRRLVRSGKFKLQPKRMSS